MKKISQTLKKRYENGELEHVKEAARKYLIKFRCESSVELSKIFISNPSEQNGS